VQACGELNVRSLLQPLSTSSHTADSVGIIAPNYNVAPGDFQPAICRSRDIGERELVMMRWGIVPWFAKSEDEF
jgi:putative SOS response-associated peptidase YedK